MRIKVNDYYFYYNRTGIRLAFTINYSMEKTVVSNKKYSPSNDEE